MPVGNEDMSIYTLLLPGNFSANSTLPEGSSTSIVVIGSEAFTLIMRLAGLGATLTSTLVDISFTLVAQAAITFE